ncbi:sensor domain-containing protein [Rhodococcus sp. NPDC058505]|uniref:sensor domain-containing protein n=1 Tax=unclassified Rhodococcus (in: high G+C Gram-positive bacteria) TaxID=192944 RepID=UPI0036483995
MLMAGAAAATLVVAGCSSHVSGVAEPVGGAATPAAGTADRVEAPLASMLPAPDDFPAPYQALVLPEQAVEQAAADLDGIPAGAKVDPAGCKPPPQNFGPDATALIVGTDNDARATVSVELTRVDTPLSVRANEIDQCLELTTTKSGATATVATTVLPAPPLNADDTLALRQTVTSGTPDRTVTQSMLKLFAQVDDVRISATHMSFGAGTPDSVTLDQLFTETVQKVTAAAK